MSALVVYFSVGGTTQSRARAFARGLRADIYQIRTQKKYPSSFLELYITCKREFDFSEFPELVDGELDLEEYDKIFLGFPIWLGTCPRAVLSFVKQNDLRGKVIYPFCCSKILGTGVAKRDIANIATEAIVLDGIRANDVKDDKLKKWLNQKY